MRARKRRVAGKNPLTVTGQESYLEAVQLVMAALTLDHEGPQGRIWATEAVFALDHAIGVAALWTTLGTLLSGFDSKEESLQAVQLMAEGLARIEDRIDPSLR